MTRIFVRKIRTTRWAFVGIFALLCALLTPLASPFAVAEDAAEQPRNISSQSNEDNAPTVSVSYVPSWNHKDALNDDITDKADHGSVWGTYGDFAAQHWAQYEWPTEVTASSSSLWLWNDKGVDGADNVHHPASWLLQYWDNNTQAWVPITAQYPVPEEKGQIVGPTTVTFDPVTTTKMRLILNANKRDNEQMPYYSVASTEWQVFGTMKTAEPEPGDSLSDVSIEEVSLRTAVGVMPTLPPKVWVLPENGPLAYHDVTWDPVDASKLNTPGEVEITGHVGDKPVKGTIFVLASPAAGTLEHLDNASTVTTAGVAPVCPNTVVAQYSDGSADSTLPVTWDPVDPSAYAKAETFGDILGTVAASSERAVCTFWVVEPFDSSKLPPHVSVSIAESPAASGWFTTTPHFTITTEQRAHPIATVEYSFDNGATWTAYPQAPVAVDKEGSLTILARATDDAGQSATAQQDVMVDTKAPTADIGKWEDSDPNVHWFSITGSDGENGSGVQRIIYSSGPSQDPESTANDMWATYEEEFSLRVTDAPVYLHVRVQDAAGHQSQTYTVKLDPVTPEPQPEPTPEPNPQPEPQPEPNPVPNPNPVPTPGAPSDPSSPVAPAPVPADGEPEGTILAHSGAAIGTTLLAMLGLLGVGSACVAVRHSRR
ncbi:Ig-like domain-containing protein [Trueperella sp. LYQ143]|uniref:Ig-like domain-containing protein n=1 Tax=unclassified Trueperella TaxID=2630174 RepID=UPI0039832F3E